MKFKGLLLMLIAVFTFSISQAQEEPKKKKPAPVAKTSANPKDKKKEAAGSTNRIDVSDQGQPTTKKPVKKAANKDNAVVPKK